ncbi:hypothetical protein K7432_000122 [Basidiobolus ranarum]|uniref:Calcium uniporter protein, mitochondrial n=1 Tax=Basidiobolus ranarum TaxID=34480 RepID=A0ABR2X574_9FUNG
MSSPNINLGKLSLKLASRFGASTLRTSSLLQNSTFKPLSTSILKPLNTRTFLPSTLIYTSRLYSSASLELPDDKLVEVKGEKIPLGRIDFAVSNGLPRLTIPLQTPGTGEVKEHSFILHPELTLSNLYHQIRDHGGDIKLVHVHDSLKNFSIGARWTAGASIDDLIQESTMSDAKSFYIITDDTKILIRMPSFKERTASLNSQLINLQSRLDALNRVKHKCDVQANRTSQMISIGGFAGLCTYCGVMSKLVWVDLGWGVMEPFTYFSGIGAATIGYLYFLVTKRDFTTDSVSNMAATQRQIKLYVENGLNIDLYQHLTQQANRVREEIDRIRTSYN